MWTKNELFIIAEIGGNHEGDFDYAVKLTELACSSKAHSVKYQIYTGDTLVSPVESPDRNKHFKKFELSESQYKTLAEICRSNGKDFSVSVWNPDSISWVDDYVTFYKIGSGDMNCYPMIEKFIQKKKPIVISTGLSSEDEVIASVNYIQNADSFYKAPENLAVLQCNSMYPSPDSDINLNTLTRFRELFPDVTIGYSDHSLDTLAAHCAVTLGAKVIEVHFTDTREGKTFRDHMVSFTAEEINDLHEQGSRIQTLLGKSKKHPTKSELDSGHRTSFRRATYFNRDILKGEEVRKEDLCFLRPCHGIPSHESSKVVGQCLQTNHPAFKALSMDLFE